MAQRQQHNAAISVAPSISTQQLRLIYCKVLKISEFTITVCTPRSPKITFIPKRFPTTFKHKQQIPNWYNDIMVHMLPI